MIGKLAALSLAIALAAAQTATNNIAAAVSPQRNVLRLDSSLLAELFLLSNLIAGNANGSLLQRLVNFNALLGSRVSLQSLVPTSVNWNSINVGLRLQDGNLQIVNRATGQVVSFEELEQRLQNTAGQVVPPVSTSTGSQGGVPVNANTQNGVNGSGTLNAGAPVDNSANSQPAPPVDGSANNQGGATAPTVTDVPVVVVAPVDNAQQTNAPVDGSAGTQPVNGDGSNQTARPIDSDVNNPGAAPVDNSANTQPVAPTAPVGDSLDNQAAAPANADAGNPVASDTPVIDVAPLNADNQTAAPVSGDNASVLAVSPDNSGSAGSNTDGQAGNNVGTGNNDNGNRSSDDAEQVADSN